MPGGANNIAGGEYSFAAGQQAQAQHQGAFVWADSQNASFTDSGQDTFNVRAQGGVNFVTGGKGMTIDGQPVLANNGTGAILSGTFTGNGSGLTSLNPANLSGGTANISILGNATTATTATTATSVTSVGGVTAANVASGANAANALLKTNATFSFAAGPGAGNYSALFSGSYNIGIGLLALSNNTGSHNIAVGYNALPNNSGSQNTAIGYQALWGQQQSQNTTGWFNTAVGNVALENNTTGSFNTALGYQALENVITGSNNIGIGYNAGENLSSGYSNIYIGNQGNTVGEYNTIRIGTAQTDTWLTGTIHGNGSGLTGISASALPSSPTFSTVTASDFTATTGGAFYGNGSGLSNLIATNLTSIGNGNFFVGPAGSSSVSDHDNTAIGVSALNKVGSGSVNTASGYSALQYNTTGNGNTAIGSTALLRLGSNNFAGGSNNIALGVDAGSAYIGNESSNILIGNVGSLGENYTIRLGNANVQTSAYIAGISGVTPSGALLPVVINANGQLGTGTASGGGNGELTASTLTLAATTDSNPDVIYSGSSLLLFADNHGNFFTGDAGNTATGGLGGGYNTGAGFAALSKNTSGTDNTANGRNALQYNTTGNGNTAIGSTALLRLGSNNFAGGSNNIALGVDAGSAYIGNGEQQHPHRQCRLAGRELHHPPRQRQRPNQRLHRGHFGGNSLRRLASGGDQCQRTAWHRHGQRRRKWELTASTLTLAATTDSNPDVIYSGSSLLLFADNHGNFFTGDAGNTATGGLGGGYNTGAGFAALSKNTSGTDNTANGYNALQHNTSGTDNTANGDYALRQNTTGNYNTAVGEEALSESTTGYYNTAVGDSALQGLGSLFLGTDNPGGGTNNIALGYYAGGNYSGNESSNIVIGNFGSPGENYTIRLGDTNVQTSAYIAGISGVTPSGALLPVVINANGQLGTGTASGGGSSSPTFSGTVTATSFVSDSSGDFVAGSADSGNSANGSAATVGGGHENNATGFYATVGGGVGNAVGINRSGYDDLNPDSGTISGGAFNNIDGTSQGSFIGGGDNSTIQNGTFSTIAGGSYNQATSSYATVPGGAHNIAGGEYSFAAGQQAQALNQGAFVWADSQNPVFTDAGSDTFNVRAQGGVVFTSGSTAGNNTVSWTPGAGSWSFTSDRNAKENFAPLDVQAILGKVAELPLAEWNYKGYL